MLLPGIEFDIIKDCVRTANFSFFFINLQNN